MNSYRRLIRYLARHEIEGALELGKVKGIESATEAWQRQVEIAHQSAFMAGHAQGHQFGQQQAFDAIWRQVQERCGVSPFADVMAGDVERAKRGLIH